MKAQEITIESYKALPGGTFPTLRSLTDAQNYDDTYPKQAERARAPAPRPFPSRRRKRVLLKNVDFKEIDNHATSLIPAPNKKWSDLSQELFDGHCTSNLEKVWAAFCFACQSRKLPEFHDAVVSKAYEDIRLRKYCKIFGTLLRKSEVPYWKIQGHKKSTNREIGWHYDKPNGVWFACWVEGEWRLVDPSWGAASEVTAKASGDGYVDFEAISDEYGAKAKRDLRFQRNNFFFLTDPEHLIVSHFPTDPEWQLLARPLSIEEFDQMPHYFSGSEMAMELYYKVEPALHRKNAIHADRDPVELSFNVPEDQLELEFDIVQSISVEDLSLQAHKSIVDPTRNNRNKVFCGGYQHIIFHPPCAGKFKLVVQLRPKSPAEGEWIRYLTYIVHYNPKGQEKETQVEVSPTQQLLIAHTEQSADPVAKLDQSTSTAPCRYQMQVSRAQLATLRSYVKPPEITFNVVKATLLLLGFYEKRTRKWHRCQPLINAVPQAVKDIVVSTIDPRIAARSHQLLQVSKETEATLASADDAAMEFYNWAKYTTEAIPGMIPEKIHEPSSVELQKHLLGVTPQEDAHWDWEDDVVRDDNGRRMIGFCESCHVAVYSSDLKSHLHCCVTSSNSNGRHTARV